MQSSGFEKACFILDLPRISERQEREVEREAAESESRLQYLSAVLLTGII